MIEELEAIKAFAQDAISDWNWSHDWDHTLRVYNLAMHIAKVEWADLDVIAAASLLHDVSRHVQDKSKWKICHAEHWSVVAKAYLEVLWLDENFIAKVVSAIRTHRFRGNNIPDTLESKIIYDADKLDSIWAVGIARSFHFAWDHKAKLHDINPNLSKEAEYTQDDTAYREFHVRLKYIKDKLFTQEARNIAKKRHDFMIEFFDRFNEEFLWNI